MVPLLGVYPKDRVKSHSDLVTNILQHLEKQKSGNHLNIQLWEMAYAYGGKECRQPKLG